ncbi:transposase [Ferroplasma sp. Type II]|uniref:transposase n=1 Tax=Ferroplasma sp. Type II TaxID=261388 RepID=UPI00373FCE91
MINNLLENYLYYLLWEEITMTYTECCKEHIWQIIAPGTMPDHVHLLIKLELYKNL